jgi:hypothetical protein
MGWNSLNFQTKLISLEKPIWPDSKAALEKSRNVTDFKDRGTITG